MQNEFLTSVSPTFRDLPKADFQTYMCPTLMLRCAGGFQDDKNSITPDLKLCFVWLMPTCGTQRRAIFIHRLAKTGHLQGVDRISEIARTEPEDLGQVFRHIHPPPCCLTLLEAPDMHACTPQCYSLFPSFANSYATIEPRQAHELRDSTLPPPIVLEGMAQFLCSATIPYPLKQPHCTIFGVILVKFPTKRIMDHQDQYNVMDQPADLT